MATEPKLGQLVEIITSGTVFEIAGIDDDCVMRAEDGAWFNIADVVEASA
jgi:hypothetical protein